MTRRRYDCSVSVGIRSKTARFPVEIETPLLARVSQRERCRRCSCDKSEKIDRVDPYISSSESVRLSQQCETARTPIDVSTTLSISIAMAVFCHDVVVRLISRQFTARSVHKFVHIEAA